MLGAHPFELGQPALVAAAARGHAALEPAKLDRQLGVELLRRPRFLLVDPLGPGVEAAEADLGAAQLGPVEPQAALRQALQEGAVVADDDESALEALQPVLEPFDRAEVEMVGWLVEQQHVGRLGECADDCRPPPFAAAGGRGGPVEVDADLVGHRRGFVRLRGAGSG